MSALSHPATRSFFACGDFNQRLTVWGTRSTSEIGWADTGIGIEKVTIGYRQSRELNAFARQIVHIAGGAEHDVVLPEHADRDGVPPLLVEEISSDANIGKWLANRITEIENFVGQLPSIAILVPEEAQVEPVCYDPGEAAKTCPYMGLTVLPSRLLKLSAFSHRSNNGTQSLQLSLTACIISVYA